jgi:hypothetical protein
MTDKLDFNVGLMTVSFGNRLSGNIAPVGSN